MRRTARIVGILFLAGFLAYGVGNLIATGIVRSADRSGSTALFVTGAALMLLNSAFVIGIGVLLFPILRAHNKAIAAGYLGTRIFEGVVLAIGVVSLIVVTGSAAAIPGGLFELTFAIWLIVRGFASTTTVPLARDHLTVERDGPSHPSPSMTG